MKIVIETGLPRNLNCGDWQELYDGTIQITVAEMPVKSFAAVAIHELIEFLLCKEAKISDLSVSQFDAQFEQERLTGKHAIEDEAGDDMRACYREQHQSATFAERSACAALRLDWKDHEEAVLSSLA